MRRNYKKAEQLLASEDPLWFCLVDVDELDITSGTYCVFGQVERRLRPVQNERFTDGYLRFIQRHGIGCGEEEEMGIVAFSERSGDIIQRHWRRRIKELQAAHNCADKESAVPAGSTADREEE
jgi:hypothetical protein